MSHTNGEHPRDIITRNPSSTVSTQLHGASLTPNTWHQHGAAYACGLRTKILFTAELRHQKQDEFCRRLGRRLFQRRCACPQVHAEEVSLRVENQRRFLPCPL